MAFFLNTAFFVFFQKNKKNARQTNNHNFPHKYGIIPLEWRSSLVLCCRNVQLWSRSVNHPTKSVQLSAAVWAHKLTQLSCDHQDCHTNTGINPSSYKDVVAILFLSSKLFCFFRSLAFHLAFCLGLQMLRCVAYVLAFLLHIRCFTKHASLMHSSCCRPWVHVIRFFFLHVIALDSL